MRKPGKYFSDIKPNRQQRLSAMLADGMSINNKSLINSSFGRLSTDEQMNKTCTLVFKSAAVPS